jgi:hypothetical protein
MLFAVIGSISNTTSFCLYVEEYISRVGFRIGSESEQDWLRLIFQIGMKLGFEAPDYSIPWGGGRGGICFSLLRSMPLDFGPLIEL